MENWERKFNVDPSGNAEEVQLSEEEQMKRFKEMHPQKKKLIRLEGVEGSESLEARVMGGKIEVLNILEQKYPDLVPALEKLINPSISNEDYFETVEAFNQSHMAEKTGLYDTLHVRGDHGNITVKYYKNGSASISASWQE